MLSSFSSRAVVATLLYSACSPVAYSAEGDVESNERVEKTDNVYTHETFTVYGKGYRTTGTKSELKPMEAPMSYEVYDNELLELRQVDSVNQALRYVPGITPESRGSVSIYDQYTIRGFETYFNYYDGLPLQSNKSWNLYPQIDAFATESIEVLKGPTSVLYGAAPAGGMVNQTAKQPSPEQETRVRTRVGTNNLYELGVDSKGAISDSVDYRIIALGRHKDGQQITTEEERYTLAPSLTWQMSDKTSLNLNLYRQYDPQMTPSTPLPSVGTVYKAPYGRLDADAYAGDKNWAKFARQQTLIGYKLNHEFNKNVAFLQAFRYTDANAQQKNTYNVGLEADSKTLNRVAYSTDEKIKGFVVDNQLSFTFQTGAISHNLLTGLEYQQLSTDINYQDMGTIATIDMENPDHSQINPDTLSPDGIYLHDIHESQTGLYIQDEMSWQALTVVAGLRWDNYKSKDKNTSTDLTKSETSYSVTDIDQNATSMRLGAIYAFDNGLSPYVSYAQSFEPVAGVDSYTHKTFEPTTADQIETGLKFENLAIGTTLTLAAFDITKKNVVVNTPDFSKKTQNGAVRSKGVELSWTQMVGPSLDVTTALTSMDVQVTENPQDTALEGKTPVFVAEKMASIWADYYATEALTLGTGIRYIGEQQLDAHNTDTIPSVTLVDASVSYALHPSLTLGLTVNNLFNKTYVSSCYDGNNCWMGSERTVQLSLDARF
ncbi:TonB-dependent siderophore receptor [Candidatus Sororendozoicomonas aggregata]|uniref:TonB-dependent siderophore receptor n=1 Tax=Candidatus Sororendozoicomonas aggregata TaxID=3073239 RepID=UPI002ED22989